MSTLMPQRLSALVLKHALDAFNYQHAKQHLDWLLLACWFALICVGLVFEASASVAISESITGEPFYYLQKHLIFLLMGLSAAFIVFQIPISLWMKYSHWVLFLAFALLVVVLIPGVGIRVNGSQRWLNLGLISFQVSEFAKMAMILFVAAYLVRRRVELREQWSGFSKPMLILGLMLILLLLEPDFGSAVVISGTVLGMLFIAGIPLFRFLLTMSISVAVLAWLATSSTYRMNRILAFMDPWADQFNTGYQLTQALIAFGRGEWFGVGLGNSLQKLFYLPEAHTDFVFAVIAEETGLVGAFLLIALLWIIGQRILKIGKDCLFAGEHDRTLQYAGFLAVGIGIMFLAQCFINIGVACGLLPTKGLTLPFISYGGSSLLIWSVMMAVVLRAAWELELYRKGSANKGQEVLR